MRRPVIQSLIAVLVALAAAACGSSASSPAGPGPAASLGATVQGKVETGGVGASSLSQQGRSSPANIKVTAVNTGISATTDGSGRFVLSGLPSGTLTLRFEGQGIDAELQISGLVAGQVLQISVRVSGQSATLTSSPSSGDDDEDSDADEVEFTGAIESIGEGSLVVAGRTVVVDDSTKIKDGDGPIAFSDLAVGDVVEVEGVAQADGSVLATKISVEDEDDEDSDDDSDEDSDDEDSDDEDSDSEDGED